jgi:hypothetical protein
MIITWHNNNWQNASKTPIYPTREMTSYCTRRRHAPLGNFKQLFKCFPLFCMQHAFRGLAINLTLKQVKALVKDVDISGSGALGPDGFMQLLLRNQQVA